MEHENLNTPQNPQMKQTAPTDRASQSWRKCYNCGKFLSYKQLEERKDVMQVYIPDTEHTQEQSYWVHKHCW